MKNIKIQLLIVFAMIIGIGLLVHNCHQDPPHSAITSNGKLVPNDSNFAPVQQNGYRLPSLPFSHKSSGVKLPAGMSERDVDRVISFDVKPHGSNDSVGADHVDIIEGKDGEIYVMKDSTIDSLAVTKFEPPVMDFGFRIGAGIDAELVDKGPVFSPAVSFAPLRWYGNLDLPVLGADLNGLVLGTDYRLYHDIFIGGGISRTWDGGNGVKVAMVFYF